ncbi:MAG TPA: epimerase, partial [Acidimicrobiaceae bacterium]|nr:epimerase [Acidimicrobiaceae bacterium]
MKVAITGASGFLGSHCMAAAVAAGHEVRAVVRNPAK